MTFEGWLKTKEGMDSADFKTLTSGEYLKNRLWYAFMARQPEIDQLQKTIEWYEDELKKLRLTISEPTKQQ